MADIIAGKSADGTHVGMAPGAKLLAHQGLQRRRDVLQRHRAAAGIDFALDPNGDGNLGDAADIINLSLGSDYGQIEDDLTAALEDAVDLGVVVVASAGNGSNKPYVVGSPSIGPGVISVAQTQVPSAVAIPLVVNSPASIAGVYGNTATVEWAPIGAGVTGDVAFIGRGCPAGSVAPGSPADPILSSPAGKIALIDRGACSVSLKVDCAVDNGAIGVLIGLVAPGDAVSFSFGGGDSFVPTLVIQQSLSNAIKAQLNAAQTVNVSISPACGDPAGRQHGEHVLARTVDRCRPSSPKSARRVPRCRRRSARATARRHSAARRVLRRWSPVRRRCCCRRSRTARRSRSSRC